MKHSWQNRFLALFLAVVMVFGYIPTFAFATEGTEPQETTAAADETTAPVDETTAPADETTAPVDETTAPADETTAPVDETTAPADETTAPVDETTAPADETTAPAETDPADDDLDEEDEEIMPLDDGEFPNSGLSVVSNKASTLAAGVTENKYTVYDKNGAQVKMFVATADPSVSTVKMYASYLNMDPTKFGMSKLTEQVAAFNEKAAAGDTYYQGSVVAGINASYYNMTTGQPTGIFVMNGVVGNASESAGYFAVMKDGSVKIGVKGDYANDAGNIQEAIGIYTMLIIDGEICSGLNDSQKYPRQTIGITADGKVVIMSADGAQAPTSIGLTMLEQAQVMQDLGCVWAGHLDGGGSMTYGSRPEGSDTFKIVNSPSDGSERSISNGFIIVSTEAQSKAFSKVKFEVENEYIAPGASIAVEATGVSQSGSAADIPAEVVYSATNGTISDGIYTAGETVGADTIVATLNGTVVGSVDVNIVIPDAIAFDQAEMVVPYGKTVEIAVTATTNSGLNPVKICENTVEFTFDNEIGTMDGFAFTAAEAPEATSAVCTVTVVGTEVSASANITLGKGSEVIADFNDGEIGSWKTQQLLDFNYYFPGNKVSVENGALRVEVDYSNSFESGYMCTGLGTSETYVIENGLALGFRIFVPEESEGLRLRMCFYDENNARKTADLLPIGKVSTLEKGAWYYVKADISAYPTVKILEGKVWLEFYICDRDDLTNYGYNHLDYDSLNTKLAFYIDDITVDYSSAVEDREAPVFANPTYAGANVSDAVALSNGVTINSATIDFAASVDDAGVGINADSARAYVDGNEIGATYSNGLITANATLTSGKHHIKFEVADKNGNTAILTRSFTVSGGSKAEPVKLVAHDASLNNVLFGSIYYVDLVAAEIENVKSVSVDLDLNNMNKWELSHMEVAEGFTASYTVSEDNNVAKVTVTRKGTVTATGEAALVSIPIRVYEMPIKPSDSEGAASPVGSVYTYASFKKVGSKGESWPVSVTIEVDKGIVTYTNGATDYFSGEDVKVMTEAQWWHNDSSTGSDYLQWNGGHDHRAETKQYYAEALTNHVDAVALDDKAATCTEAGYTGRTYCETCHSVVDWGTTIPATGHTYDFVDGVLKCTSCGETFTGTWTDGKEYVDGVTASDGWRGNSYYVDGEKLTGVQKVTAPDGSGEFYYDFGEDGISQGKYIGLYYDEEAGVYRYIKLGEIASGWQEIDGEWYYFRKSTMAAATGHYHYDGDIYYDFEETGRLTSGVWVEYEGGTRYYYGPTYYRAKATTTLWVTINGGTYCFDDQGYRMEGLQAIYNANGRVPTLYNLTTDGQAILASAVHEDYLYIDGVRQNCYQLVMLDGDFYFVNDGHKIAKNTRVYLSAQFVEGKTFADGTPVSVGYYEFDADGKMLVKNGPVGDYFYKYGVQQKCYQLVEFEGDFYFINDGHKLAKNTKLYLSEKFVEGKTFADGTAISVGYYEFDADGKMVVKNGPVGDYFYKYGIQQKCYQLVEFEGDFYFINDGNKLAKNTKLYLSERFVEGKTFADGTAISVGYYEFDADGKMLVKNGPVGDYFYKYGIQQKCYQLVEYEGDFYFINDGNKLAKNTKLYLSERFVEGKTFADGTAISVGYYEFDADGKMLVKNGPMGDYFYKYGIRQKCYQLVEFEGNFYFINDGSKLAKNCKLYLSEKYVEGKTYPDGTAVQPGLYTFDAEGKMH